MLAGFLISGVSGSVVDDDLPLLFAGWAFEDHIALRSHGTLEVGVAEKFFHRNGSSLSADLDDEFRGREPEFAVGLIACREREVLHAIEFADVDRPVLGRGIN